MVQSPQIRRITPREALAALRAAGVPQEVLAAVTNAVNDQAQTLTLVSLAEAARLTGVRLTRLTNWVDRGHLAVIDQVRGMGQGGLQRRVAIEDVRRLLANPPRRTGRPRKVTV